LSQQQVASSGLHTHCLFSPHAQVSFEQFVQLHFGLLQAMT